MNDYEIEIMNDYYEIYEEEYEKMIEALECLREEDIVPQV